MCVCIYMCIYVCAYICVYICIYTHTHIYGTSKLLNLNLKPTASSGIPIKTALSVFIFLIFYLFLDAHGLSPIAASGT